MKLPILEGQPNRWQGCANEEGRPYRCGWCDKDVSANFRYLFASPPFAELRICPSCKCPSFFCRHEQWPLAMPGSAVDGLPEEIDAMFLEVRLAASAGAHTGAVTLARTLLLRIAWDLGAPGSISTFKSAVEWLVNEGHVGKGAKAYLDHVKDSGNESVHLPVLMDQSDSTLVVELLVIVLRALYEGKHLLSKVNQSRRQPKSQSR